MSQSGWFYISNGQRLGPIPIDQLRQMTAVGQVRAGDLVWTEGMPDWQPANAVPGLMAAAPAPPPPAYYPQQQAYPPQQQGYPQQGYAQQAYPQQGYAQQPYPNYGQAGPHYANRGQSSQGLAVAGLVCSFLCSLVGLILSLIALSNMKKYGNEDGKGMAIAGLVLSIIFTLLMFLGFVMAANEPHY